MSNPSFLYDVFKVGRSFSDPEKRCTQLFTTGVPTPFNLEFKLYVNNAELFEKRIHKLLDKYRIFNKREFFKINKNELIEIIKKENDNITLEDYNNVLDNNENYHEFNINNNSNNEIIKNDNNEKSKFFCCSFCEYSSSRNSQYKRHLLTDKHKRKMKDNKKIPKIIEDKTKRYICKCGNNYYYSSGLSKHKLKCNLINNKDIQNTQNTNENLIEILKKNQELIMEQNKIIIELSKNNFNETVIDKTK